MHHHQREVLEVKEWRIERNSTAMIEYAAPHRKVLEISFEKLIPKWDIKMKSPLDNRVPWPGIPPDRLHHVTGGLITDGVTRLSVEKPRKSNTSIPQPVRTGQPVEATFFAIEWFTRPS
jgi:hypothetical protein